MARGVKTGGRKVGSKNKVTAAAKEAIELAFEGIGGVAALTKWAKSNRTTFYGRVWPKLLPLQLVGDAANPIVTETIIRPQLSRDEWLKLHSK